MTETAAQEPAIAAVEDLEVDAAGVFDPVSRHFKGGQCGDCGALSLPQKFICHACTGNTITQVLIPATGNLYSYSTLHVSASRATPYTLGYIDLDCGLRILGNVTSPVDQLACDIPVGATACSASPSGWAFVLQTEGNQK